jgi:uncharacterized protein
MQIRLKGLILATALISAAITSTAARADTFVNILTGGQSGVYYPLGVAIEKILAEKVPGLRPSVQATKASVENLNLIQAGRGEVGFTLGDALRDAGQGNAEAGFAKPLDKLRVIGAIYPNYVQIVASADSGIKTLADLKGKRLSVGAAKSGTELNARAILGAAGIHYSDLAKVEYLPFAESVELMKNRQIDATLQSAGLGVASLRDLASSVAITVVEVPPAIIDKIGSPYTATVIPAGTYTGQDKDVPTAAVVNYLVTRSDLDEETVYQITKAIFENLPDLVAAHAAAKAIKLDSATAKGPVPLHPGAARYFKEKNLL